jgi:O-antigen ligase
MGRRVAHAALAITLTIAFAGIGLRALRPDALPSNLASPLDVKTEHKTAPGGPTKKVHGATVLHRAILMWTAAEVFFDHPVVGVGWTRSDAREVVTSPGVLQPVKRRFPQAWRGLFADAGPVGAHDALLQVLADLGIVGGIPFAAVVALALALGLLEAWPDDGSSRRVQDARLAVLTVLLVMVGTLVTTGLFPGQPETNLLAWGLGLATVAPVATRRSRSAGATTAGGGRPVARAVGHRDLPA